MRFIILCISLSLVMPLHAQTDSIRVHFMYGSKPLKAYKQTERKWFGGILGGHVGIEVAPDQILSFLPKGEFHKVAHAKNRHSKFSLHSFQQFYSLFGTPSESVKKYIVQIPISKEQYIKLDSISSAYQNNVPYDYAFIGMRCGAAAYDILAQLNVVKPYSYRKTYRKIFYPKKLRKQLQHMAIENQWPFKSEPGTIRRRWERD